MDADQFVATLKARRLELGLTQRDVADQIPVSQSLLSYWERRLADPSTANLRRWTEVLDAEAGAGDD